MFRAPKPPPPPPPPAPVEMPRNDQPDIRQRMQAETEAAKRRKGARSTLLTGVLGDAMPAQPAAKATLLGG